MYVMYMVANRRGLYLCMIRESMKSMHAIKGNKTHHQALTYPVLVVDLHLHPARHLDRLHP